MRILMFVIKGLPVIGLILNLVGAILLSCSVKPSPNNSEAGYPENGKHMGIVPYALFNKKFVKTGLKLIILGFFIQLLAFWFQ